MPDSSSRLLPSRRLRIGLFGYNRAEVQAYLSELEGSERAALDIWTRALELERDSVSRARERATTMRDLLHHLERETAILEGQVATAKATADLLDVGAQHEIYRLEQIYQLRREQLAQLVPAIDRERQKIDQGLRQMMSAIRDTMLQTTAAISPGIDHDVQFAAVAPVLFGSELDAAQIRARPLAGNRTRLDVPSDRLRVQSRDGKLSGSVTGIVVTGLPPRVLGYVIGSTDDTERAIAAQDVVAIGQHTVMVKPEARLMNLEDLPEMPEGQALRAVNRLAAPGLESIGQAAAALAENAPPAALDRDLAASDQVVSLAQTSDQRSAIEPAASAAQQRPSGEQMADDLKLIPEALPTPDLVAAEPTPAAGPMEAQTGPTDQSEVTEQPPATGIKATVSSDGDPTAEASPAASEATPPALPAMAPESPSVDATPTVLVPPPISIPSPVQAAQVAQVVQPSAGPTLAELAGLLPPPSWQVDVPAAQAGSDLLSDASKPQPVPSPMTMEPTVPPMAAPPVAPLPVGQTPAPISQPAAPVTPLSRPAPTPEMGAASSGGAVDVLAFLEGKVVGQDIYNSAGELLAAKDMMIDAALVQRVDAAGRLPELIVYMTFPGLAGPAN